MESPLEFEAEARQQAFDPVEDAIADIAAGKLIVVTDDASRENEGDLVMAAAKVTPEAVNMMIRHARGLICAPTVAHQLRRLGIHQMVQENREAQQTDFSISVDAAEGITTGISAYDRATTLQILADPNATPDQLVQPGHIFPLRAKPGGVLERAGHTEAAVDLASLAGLHPSGVICEILKEDGSMARLPDLIEFKLRHGLKLISIASLIEYRHRRDKLVERLTTRPFECSWGCFDLHLFRSRVDGRQHIALTLGQLDTRPTLVRVHSENLLADLFRSRAMGSGNSLELALSRVAEAGHGVILYIGQPNMGLRLEDAANAANPDVAPAKMDFRDYGIGAQILADLGLKQIRLLSSSRRRVVALDGYGLEIVDHVPLSDSSEP
ncbi:MAG: 3,4-dihydroxy-2-butanone-4-phosphate synthase [Opitutales bacterium]